MTESEPKFYDNFFKLIIEMRYKIDEIKDKIDKYGSYTYKSKVRTVLSFILMALTGIGIPLIVLFHGSTNLLGILGMIFRYRFRVINSFSDLLHL